MAANVATLTAAQVRTEERLDQLTARTDALAEAQVLTERRLGESAEAQARTERSVRELAEAQARTERRLDTLIDQVVSLRGWVLQARYRERAHAYFQTILRRIRVLSMNELATLVDKAEEDGVITWIDRGELLNADLVIRGRLPNQAQDAYLVAEVSVAVDPPDVDRAARRAGILRRIVDVPVIAAAAGTRLTREGQHEATQAGVETVIHVADVGEVA